MKIIIFSILILMSWNLRAEQKWLIRDTTIISADQDHALTHQDILFSPQGIEQIGRNLDAGNAFIIDGRRRYVIPGLMDSHVHLGSYGGVNEEKLSKTQELIKQFTEQEPRSYLYFGFTSLVDLKQSESFAKQWSALAIKPDLVYCKALPFSNGYGMAFEPQGERFENPYFIYDEQQANLIPNSVNPAEHSPAELIEKIQRTGAGCIKTFNENGFGGLWNWPTPPDSTIKSLHQLAKNAHLIHLHHANSLTAQEQAVATEVDVIAHGLWHWEDLNHQKTLPKQIKQLLDRIITKGIFYQATARVLGGEIDLYDTQFLHQKNLKHSLPKALIEWHMAGNSEWFKKVMEKRIRMHPEIVERFLGRKATGMPSETSKEAMQRLTMVINYLSKNGGIVLLASDTPSSPTYTNPPGLNGLLEIYQLQQMGMSLKQIFNAATLNNARAFGLDKQIGSVSRGKKANLLILKQNPWETISAYDSIETVIISGRPIKRTEFSAHNIGHAR